MPSSNDDENPEVLPALVVARRARPGASARRGRAISEQRQSPFVELAQGEELERLPTEELTGRMVERTRLDEPRARELLSMLRASLGRRSRSAVAGMSPEGPRLTVVRGGRAPDVSRRN